MWVDVRIPLSDAGRAVDALAAAGWAVHVDPAPPAAGPEAELTIQIAGDAGLVSATLRDAGVTPLAARLRLWERR